MPGGRRECQVVAPFCRGLGDHHLGLGYSGGSDRDSLIRPGHYAEATPRPQVVCGVPGIAWRPAVASCAMTAPLPNGRLRSVPGLRRAGFCSRPVSVPRSQGGFGRAVVSNRVSGGQHYPLVSPRPLRREERFERVAGGQSGFVAHARQVIKASGHRSLAQPVSVDAAERYASLTSCSLLGPGQLTVRLARSPSAHRRSLPRNAPAVLPGVAYYGSITSLMTALTCWGNSIRTPAEGLGVLRDRCSCTGPARTRMCGWIAWRCRHW